MRRGMLSDLFVGVVSKRLTLVETITPKSNQHEFQGTRPLRNLLGDEDRRQIATRFLSISGEQEAFSEGGFVSWSNVRKGKDRAARSEEHTSELQSLMRISYAVFRLK